MQTWSIEIVMIYETCLPAMLSLIEAGANWLMLYMLQSPSPSPTQVMCVYMSMSVQVFAISGVKHFQAHMHVHTMSILPACVWCLNTQ
jgi:hypothetical protein